MVTISLCMIVRDEERVLGRCLDSVKDIVDEIIIVDTGSLDGTKQIASKYTDKVFDFKWIDDFSAARNFSFSKATKDCVFWLDADDIITQDNKVRLTYLKQNLPQDIAIVMLGYDLGGNFFSTRERIFRRDSVPVWVDPVHEFVSANGKTLLAKDTFVTHSPIYKPSKKNRNIKIYQKIIKEKQQLSPRGKYYYARELKDNGRYKQAIKYFNLFLDEGKGWIEDNIAACFNLAIIYRHLNQSEKIFESLVKSFKYDTPRPEICCLLGYYFSDKNLFSQAIFWFTSALNAPKIDSIGFVLKDYYKYIPALELTVLMDKIGDYKKANEYNEMAGSVKPDCNAYLNNKQYLASKI